MTNLAILGPGLLGGSIALAARERGGYQVAMWGRRAEAVHELKARAIAECVSTDLREVVGNAELIVLCVPIGAMSALAREMVGVMEGAIVTDVGSVKGSVCRELPPIFGSRGLFVGSHPMAGSEKTGVAAARADLFQDTVAVVTPDNSTESVATDEVAGFWKYLGSRVLHTSPEKHDRIVALISHLPHLTAAALINAVAAENPAALDFCGPGFRDTTRVASGPPEMWTEILRANRPAVRDAVEALIVKLREIATLLDHDRPMTEFLTQAKAQRDRLRLPKSPHV